MHIMTFVGLTKMASWKQSAGINNYACPALWTSQPAQTVVHLNEAYACHFGSPIILSYNCPSFLVVFERVCHRTKDIHNMDMTCTDLIKQLCRYGQYVDSHVVPSPKLDHTAESGSWVLPLRPLLREGQQQRCGEPGRKRKKKER